MSGRKMDKHRALAVLYYNYPPLTVETDAEWTEEMVDMLTCDPKADKRAVCEAHNLEYPPEWWMRAYFDEGLIYHPNNPPEEAMRRCASTATAPGSR